MLWVMIVLIIIVVIAVAAISWVRAHIVYTREAQDDQFEVEIRALFGVLKYHYLLPIIQFEGILRGISVERETSKNIPTPNNEHMKKINIDEKTILNWYEQGKAIIHHVIGFQRLLRRTLKHIHCTHIKWETDVGLQDAAETAITTGVIWGLKTSLLGTLFTHIKLEAEPALAVVPNFNQTLYRTNLDCLFTIRMGHALFAAVKLFIGIYKVKSETRIRQKAVTHS